MPRTHRQDQVESQIAAFLFGGLITIAAIAFALVGVLIEVWPAQFAIEVLMFIGIGSLVSAALIIDKEADKGGLTFWDRCFLAGFGYLGFCLVLAVIVMGVVMLNAPACMPLYGVVIALSLLAGISFFLSLMTLNRSWVWAVLAVWWFLLSSAIPLLHVWLARYCPHAGAIAV